MTRIRIPEREEQALREAGHTEVSRAVGALMVTILLATFYAVPLVQAVFSDSAGTVEVATDVLSEAARTVRQTGLLATNRVLLAGIERFEETLEEESLLRDRLLPPTQRLLTSFLKVGNEQAYLGRGGWLFLRDDFDHVTGRGFLDPELLRKARRDGARAADPLPAILGFHRDLARRGIELVIMPTPVKPTVHPEFLSARVDADRPIQNPSFAEFLDRLRAAGITVFDPTTVFADAKARDEGPLYLRTDTHWKPRAVELAARELAGIVEGLAILKQPAAELLIRRAVSVSGPGDLARMLEHPEAPEAWTSERTQLSRVLTRQGRPWAPDRTAEVLLLGDSFTNIYSDPALGWGTGSGLAEQLSFALGRSVDRIAINAGGSWSSRQALARATLTDTGVDRLSGKRVVVYQFATRELSIGDWKLLSIGAR